MMATSKINLGLNFLTVIPLAGLLAVVSTSLSTVQAQTIDNSVEVSPQQPPVAQFSVSSTQIPAAAFLDAAQYQPAQTPTNSVEVAKGFAPTTKTIATNPEGLEQLQDTAPAPIPGTTTTKANTLSIQPPVAERSQISTTPEVAQLPVDPGRGTRGGSSYVGLGANVGLSGDTALGDGNLTIISKIGLTRSLALRPGVVLGNDPIFLLPLTYEFSIRPAEALEEALRIAPYVGAGITIATGDNNSNNNNDLGLLLTGGIDVPLSRQFTANAGLNVGIADETDIGLSVGVGYNFGGFGL